MRKRGSGIVPRRMACALAGLALMATGQPGVAQAPVDLHQGATPVPTKATKPAATSPARPKRSELRKPAAAASANPPASSSAKPPAPSMVRPVVAPAASGRQQIIPFTYSAFPYDGMMPDQSTPFLDVTAPDGRKGHTSARGGVSWQDTIFSDRRALLYAPQHFDPSAPAAIVVFFHGNRATLARDVVGRQAVVRQFGQSGFNGLLVAPQLAVNALDSSAGHFWEKGFFARFLDEAVDRLAVMIVADATQLRQLPVVIVAYSGGYLPALFSLEAGGAERRIRGVILLDALFGEIPRFARWVNAHRQTTFFVSTYSGSSAAENAQLRQSLGAADPVLPTKLGAGVVAFQAATGANHNDFVTRAWTTDPLKSALSRIVEFRRTGIIDTSVEPPASADRPPRPRPASAVSTSSKPPVRPVPRPQQAKPKPSPPEETDSNNDQ